MASSIPPIGTVSSVTSANSSANAGNAANAVSSLSNTMNADTFMKMFTTQLANQDPMNPMNSSEFLNQFSQITQVQSVSELTKAMGNFQNTMSSLLHASNATQGESLLGKQVQYVDPNGNPASGPVSAVAIAPDGSVKLNVNGSAVDLGSITQVN